MACSPQPASYLLLYVTFLAETPQPQTIVIAAVLLIIAALGGFVLLSYHLRKQALPKALAGVHALLAVAGFSPSLGPRSA